MSEPESEHDNNNNNNNNNNNPFSFLFQLLGAFDHSFLVSRLTLSRLSIIFGIVFGGGGLAVIVQELINSPDRDSEVTPENIFERPTPDEIEGYEEILLSIDLACATETMQTKARKHLDVLPGTDLKITKALSDQKDLWPVYRWQCLYELSQENSATIPLGLDLKVYCKEARGVDFNYGYKDYLDPDTLYCTRIDNDVVDPEPKKPKQQEEKTSK